MRTRGREGVAPEQLVVIVEHLQQHGRLLGCVRHRLGGGGGLERRRSGREVDLPQNAAACCVGGAATGRQGLLLASRSSSSGQPTRPLRAGAPVRTATRWRLWPALLHTSTQSHTHTHNTQQADTEQAHTAQHIHSTTRDTTEHNRAHTHSEHTCGLTDLKALAAEVDQIVSVLRHSAEPALLPQQRRQSLGAGRNHVSSQLQYGFSMGIAAVGRDSPWCRPRPHLRASPETEAGRTL